MQKSISFSAGYSLVCVIVKYGMGSKVMKYAKEKGVSGGTIFLGKGTIRSNILDLLELSEVRREVLILGVYDEQRAELMRDLSHKFHFEKKHRGVLFSTGISNIFGAQNLLEKKSGKGGEVSLYKLIMTIVDRGKGEEVVEAGKKAGARGATIINARGSGVHETEKVFNMEIEPEKEVIIIIAEEELAPRITSKIREDLEIDEPGNGVIFVQDIEETHGLY